MQQCGAGLVEVRRDGSRLRFAAPPLTRSGPVDEAEAARVTAALGLDPADVVEPRLGGQRTRLGRCPGALARCRARGGPRTPARCSGVKAGLVAVYAPGCRDDGVAAEVRAFYSDGRDFAEDPVTGSLNAGLAQWLVPAGHLPERYVAAQGTAIGREGRVHVDVVDGVVWVGGATRTVGHRRAGA